MNEIYKAHMIEASGKLASFFEVSDTHVHVTIQEGNRAPWALDGLQVIDSQLHTKEQARILWKSFASIPGARITRDNRGSIPKNS